MIGARASDNRNLSTRSASKFRCVRQGLNAELFHGINRDEAVRASQSAERPKRSSKTIAGTAVGDTYSYVGTYTVHHPIVRRSALTIDTKLPAIEGVTGNHHDPRTK